MTTFTELAPAANAIVASLLNTACQSIGLVLLVWLCLRLSRRLNATSRYLIWWGTLLSIVLLTCLGVATVLPRRAPVHPETSGAPAIQPVQAGLAIPDGGVVRHQVQDMGLEQIPPQAPAIDAGHDSHALAVVGRWPMLLLTAWLGLSVLFVFALARSLLHLSKLKRNAEPVDAACRERFNAILKRHQITRRIALARSAEITAPVAVGLGKPLILIPAKVLKQLEPNELDQVLLHEVAHLSRWDDWSNLGQQLLRSFFCFHPVVLWVCRRLTLERELACDDWVVCAHQEPKAFAKCLVKLAETVTPASELATGMISPPKQLSRRIEALLDGKRAVSVGVSKIGCSSVCLILGVTWFALNELPPMIVAQEASTGQQLDTAPQPRLAGTKKATQQKDESFASALKEAEAETEQERANTEAGLAEIGQDLASGKALSDSGLIQALQQSLARLKEQIAELKKRYKEKHPINQRQEEKIQALEKQLHDTAEQVADGVRQKLFLWRAEEEKLKNWLQDLGKRETSGNGERVVRVPATEMQQSAREKLRAQVGSSLLEMVKHETNGELRAHALVALPRSEIERHLDILTDLVQNDPDSRVRKQALATLCSQHTLSSTKTVLKLYDELGGGDSELKLTIVGSLGVFPAQSPDRPDRMAVADKAVAKLKQIVKEETDPRLRTEAVQELGRLAQQLGIGGS